MSLFDLKDFFLKLCFSFSYKLFSQIIDGFLNVSISFLKVLFLNLTESFLSYIFFSVSHKLL